MRIEFEGKIHEFPDDFTEQDIASALGDGGGPSPGVATDMAKGASYGFNEGFDAMLNTVGAVTRVPVNIVANQLGYEGELLPPLKAASRFNVAGRGETTAGRAAEAIGEVAGGSVLPSAGLATAARAAGPAARGILGQYARQPGRAAGLDVLATAGAGGGVAVARENDLGPVGEVALGLAGGYAGPNAANIASRTYGAGRSGINYANRQIARAQNPQDAAYQDIADQMVRSGADPQAALQGIAPQPSNALRRRNTPAGQPFTSDDMADIVSRHMAGDAADDIARDYGLTAPTVRNYVRSYQDANPTPRNIVDMAKDSQGTGGSVPLTNQARADMAIADDPIAAQRLIQRQREQPGRVADIVEQSTVDGRSFDEEIDRLTTVARQEERAAYSQARQAAQPVNIRGVIRRWRGRRPHEGGEISESVNRAIDMFFRGGMADTGQRLRYRRMNEIIDDVPTFLERRQELDQMIAKSMQDGRPTPLTRELTQFRTDINNAARSNNQLLRDADARFSENRTIERILTRGANVGNRLTPQTRRGLREFRDMTPTQQELQRVAFERKLADDALNRRRGNAAADQFNSDAFAEIVETMYPRPRSPRGPQRTQEQQVYQRGQNMLRNLRRESTTTETTRDILSGSRTAPLQDDMAQLMEGPRAAADLATGRFGKILENLSNRLARQIGQGAAQERIRILTETDPAQMLPMLRRLAAEARTASQRQAYEHAIHQFLRVGQRPAVAVGTTGAQGEQGR